MRLNELERFTPQPFDLQGKRLLLFIVAYNAETTLERVLNRIPKGLHNGPVEVLVIDDSSTDNTFDRGIRYRSENSPFKLTVLRTSENQGYGGNQKLGYRYAIDNGFDLVALIHGDGQYAPEKLPELLQPIINGTADAVLGSRMLHQRAALNGGMPFYKWIGNQILTAFQNLVLGTGLSEFHSGYRVYSTEALAQIPFEKNANGFHFDTDIIIQLIFRKLRIAELPVPTFYGDEICYVKGLQYAWDVFKSTVRARLCQLHLFYDRKFDVVSVQDIYGLKLGFRSSHTMAIDAAKAGGKILDVGCGPGLVAGELAKKGCRVTGMDRHPPLEIRSIPAAKFIQWDLDRQEFPVNVSEFDQILLLDIIEHLKQPDHFMDELRFATGCKRPEILLTTANIGFWATRCMLFLGQFNYGKKGILDVTHTRLFTFRSMRELLRQSGYKILEMRGIPAPFPVALGKNFVSRALVALNIALIRLSKGLFSYQMFVRAEAMPTVNNLLAETMKTSDNLRRSAVALQFQNSSNGDV